jgi:hypothetical protein
MNKFKLKLTSFIFSLKSIGALALNFGECVYFYQMSFHKFFINFLKLKLRYLNQIQISSLNQNLKLNSAINYTKITINCSTSERYMVKRSKHGSIRNMLE